MTRNHCPFGAPTVCNLCGRTLYLVDIENMVGSSDLTQGEVAKTRHRIFAAVPPLAGDHSVVASSHHNAMAMSYGWTGSVQRKWRSGVDGADLELLESVADTQWVADRYARVVVASGDHPFAFAVASLQAVGVEVLVIRPDVGFSPAMRLAAGGNVVPLGTPHPDNVVNLFTHLGDAA